MDLEVKNNVTKVEELVEMIKGIDTNNKEEFQSKFQELQEAMEQKNKEIDKQTGDLESKFESKMAEMVEKITNAFPKPNLQVPQAKKYGNNFGEFLLKVRKRDMNIKDLGENDGSTGGYLVPEEFLNEILKIEMEKSVVRSSGARIIPMMRDTMKIPALNMASNAAGSMYGGVAAYWTEENVAKTESEPNFKRVKLEVNKLCAYTEASDELVDDAVVSMGSLLSDMFGEVVAFEEDQAFLTGDGVGKPLGVTVAPAYITVSRASGSVVVTSDIIGMLARFKGNLNRAKFVVNQSSLPYIYQLMDNNDNYIWHPGNSGSISEAAPGTLYGIPIVVSEKVPALGTTGDVMLCDFGYYLIGDRQGLRIEESGHFKFSTDQTVWRAVKRVDGQPWLDSAITPRAGGSTLSPFVGIS
jgi:HK97 family phage major capsid protein